MFTNQQFNQVYFSAEAIISEIEKCHLRAEHRAKVGKAISEFRKAVIRLGNKKKSRSQKTTP